MQAGLEGFILSIGKSRARENSRNKVFSAKDRVINTSLFNLVESKDIGDIIASEDAIKGVQSSLVRLVIGISRHVITQVRDISKIAQGTNSLAMLTD